jgi:Tol biopolymer transport system component
MTGWLALLAVGAGYPVLSQGDRLLRSVTTIKRDGARLDWSTRRGLIAFDMKDAGDIYQIYLMTPDGRDERCLTCGRRELPDGHKGNPEWHPSGKYILFQAQRDETDSRGPRRGRRGRAVAEKLLKVTDAFAEPGLGLHNDLWLMSSDGSRFWKLAESARNGGGVLHPQFSPGGDRILWSERLSGGNGWWGQWALKTASFEFSRGEPRLTNIQTFRPGTQKRLYESHEFTPDGRKIIFTAHPEGVGSDMGIDIYTLDLKTGELINLTDSPNEWDEHAHYSPSGNKIVWVSSKGMKLPAQPPDLQVDYWIMNADGSNKQRLTYFNGPDYAEYIPGGVAVGDFAWDDQGTRFAAYVIEDRRQERGRIVMIDLERPQ